jgi:hypothetical protein
VLPSSALCFFGVIPSVVLHHAALLSAAAGWSAGWSAAAAIALFLPLARVHALGERLLEAVLQLGVADDEHVLLVARHEADFVGDAGVEAVQARHHVGHVQPRTTVLHDLK